MNDLTPWLRLTFTTKLFAVIKVNSDYYGSIDDLEWLGIFNNQEEADKQSDCLGGYVVEVK